MMFLISIPIMAQEQVDYGTEYTVTATPNEGWEFLNWTENDEVVSTNPIYTFTVTEDRNLVANFQRLNFIIQIQVNPSGAGSVEGAGVQPAGAEVRLHAIPYESHNFDNFTELMTGDVIKENPYKFFADRDRLIVANFVPKIPYVEDTPGWFYLVILSITALIMWALKILKIK